MWTDLDLYIRFKILKEQNMQIYMLVTVFS